MLSRSLIAGLMVTSVVGTTTMTAIAGETTLMNVKLLLKMLRGGLIDRAPEDTKRF